MLKRVTDIPKPPTRPPDAHKGTAGLVLVVAGSRGMAGAAALVGNGALRAGAGLVKIATPDA
ncbi:MAG: NAD(P)H-hydrate dehydratase, partial [Phycisphaerae bacterium]